MMTHRQLLTAVWGPAHAQDTQYLRVYIGQLRQKIEQDPDDPKIICTPHETGGPNLALRSNQHHQRAGTVRDPGGETAQCIATIS